MYMEYTQLGRSGLKVSRVCLGTMNFGPETSEADSFKIMDEALEQGINFFDTANVYGRKIHLGFTEEIIGRWLEQGAGRREKIVLATKVYGGMGSGPNDARLSAYHIRKACEDSLKRLKTDHIDLYQMHHVDRNTPWEEIWQAMEWLVSQGMVTYVGSSNFAGWHIAQANEAAKSRHFMGLVSEQSIYHLNARTIELEVVPACWESLESTGRRFARWRAAKTGRRKALERRDCCTGRKAPPATRGVRSTVQRIG
jgi:aryl-alcohol dehydrogenase-like predicted oxidoreductase